MTECDNCGADMISGREPYNYTGCGFAVMLTDVLVHRCTSCGVVSVEIPNVLGLHKQLAHFAASAPLNDRRREFLMTMLPLMTTPETVEFIRKRGGEEPFFEDASTNRAFVDMILQRAIIGDFKLGQPLPAAPAVTAPSSIDDDAAKPPVTLRIVEDTGDWAIAA